MELTAVHVSDEDLIPGLIDREEAAVEALLERYWERAYRVALRLQGDPGAAEDVCQETFLQVLRSAERFEAGRSFRPWFFSILRRVASNQRRGEQRRRDREERAARPEAAPAAGTDRAEAVQRHLSTLEPKLREVLALHYLEGLTHREVGEAIGRPAGTVSYWITQGLAKLRASAVPAAALGSAALIEALRRKLNVAVPGAPRAAELAAEVATAPLDLPPAPEAAELTQAADASKGKPLAKLAAVGLLVAAGTAALALWGDRATSADGVADLTPNAGGDADGSSPLASGTADGDAPQDPPSGGDASGSGGGSADAPPAVAEGSPEPVLRGRVVFQGRPAAGVAVRGRDLRCEPRVTGPDGTFALYGETEGEVSLTAHLTHAWAWRPNRSGGQAYFALPGTTEFRFHRRVQLAEVEGELELRLQERTVSGAVVDAETQAPIAGATVWLADRTQRTDAAGAFEITAPRLLGYDPVWVTADDYALAGATLKSSDVDMSAVLEDLAKQVGADLGDGNPLEDPLVKTLFEGLRQSHWEAETAGASRPRTEVAFELDRGVPVRGVVQDAQGNPVPDVEVEVQFLVPDAALNGLTVLRDTARLCTTDAAGRFLVERVPTRSGDTGRVTVHVQHVHGFADATRELNVGPQSEPVVVTLDRWTLVRGRVIDEHGNGVAGAWLRVVDTSKPRFTFSMDGRPEDLLEGKSPGVEVRDAFRHGDGQRHRSRADGSFKLIAPEGERTVIAWVEGRVDAVFEVDAPQSEVTVVLPPAQAFAGRVRTGDGRAVASGIVRAYPAGALAGVPRDPDAKALARLPRPLAAAGLDAEGRFTLGGLGDASHDLLVELTQLEVEGEQAVAKLYATRLGVGPGELEWTVQPSGDDPRANLSTPIRVQVIGASGQPLRDGVTLILRREDGSRHDLTDVMPPLRDAGVHTPTFSAEGAGRCRLDVSAPGQPPVLTPWLSLTPGEQLDFGVVSLQGGGGSIRAALSATIPPGHTLSLEYVDPHTGETYAPGLHPGSKARQLVIPAVWPGQLELRPVLRTITAPITETELTPIPVEVRAGEAAEVRVELPAR